MAYTVKKLAKLSGVTVRTLHHYDDVGLLTPARVKQNGYRFYEEKELLKLQQILFFRELDFPLPEIKRIINNPKFDGEKALRDHKEMMLKKQKRISNLIVTIDKTIKKLKKETKMQDEELYKSFKESDKKYGEEVKMRWGNTEAYKQSKERVAKMSKEDIVALKKNADIWMKNLVENMKYGPKSPEVQKLIREHYDSLKTFYEPNLEMYKGLADMYVSDPRFTAYYEKYAKGLAIFMKEAMLYFCDNK